MNMKRFPLFAILLVCALPCLAETIEVSRFRYAGPYEVLKPFATDSLDVSGKPYTAGSVLDQKMSFDALRRAGFVNEIPAAQGSNLHLVGFNLQCSGSRLVYYGQGLENGDRVYSMDLYVDRSPIYNADRIHTPLLFLHGSADTNVPIGESIQMFTALELLGRETAFVVVDGENHGIREYGKRRDWLRTISAWFAKYLKEDASWWNEMYPPKSL